MTAFHWMLGNGVTLAFMGIGLLVTAPKSGFVGHLVPAILFFSAGAALVCASPSYRPLPPTYDEVQDMKHQLNRRLFS